MTVYDINKDDQPEKENIIVQMHYKHLYDLCVIMINSMTEIYYSLESLKERYGNDASGFFVDRGVGELAVELRSATYLYSRFYKLFLLKAKWKDIKIDKTKRDSLIDRTKELTPLIKALSLEIANYNSKNNKLSVIKTDKLNTLLKGLGIEGLNYN